MENQTKCRTRGDRWCADLVSSLIMCACILLCYDHTPFLCDHRYTVTHAIASPPRLQSSITAADRDRSSAIRDAAAAGFSENGHPIGGGLEATNTAEEGGLDSAVSVSADRNGSISEQRGRVRTRYCEIAYIYAITLSGSLQSASLRCMYALAHAQNQSQASLTVMWS